MPVFKFKGVDFIELDSLLSDDECLVRDTPGALLKTTWCPSSSQCNRDGRFPRELVRPMPILVSFGASLKGYGCAGMGQCGYGLVMQELERGDSGVRSFVSVQSALVMYPIYAFGSDAQKEQWLPAMAKGEKLGCFGLTEPDFGSIQRYAHPRKRVGNEYVINGEKMWITSGSIADVAVIWAKSEEHNNRIRGFLVETNRPGFKSGRCAWQMVFAGVHHFRTVRFRCAYSGGKYSGRIGRAQVTAFVSEPGAVWNRMGRDWGGHVLL